jgi:uncharacterized protein YkwD
MIKINSVRCLVIASLLLLLSGCGGDSSSSGDSSSGDSSFSSSSNSQTGCAAITDEQQKMLDQVNQARVNSRVCGGDNMPAVAALSWSCKLKNAAQSHSEDMRKNNFFSHTGSNGLSVSNRVTASGYVWSSVAENIAAGQTTVTQVMTGWLKSPGHCKNIMSAKSTEFGSSVVTSTSADYSHYWTQVFATPR